MNFNRSSLLSLVSSHQRSDLSQAIHLTNGTKLNEGASVALIFTQHQGEDSLLIIERAVHPKDNWSGQLAFPGGKKSPEDPHLLATCIRETYEEIQLALNPDQFISPLSDIQARKSGQLLPFYIRPHIFYVDSILALKPNDEIAQIHIVPWSHLINEANHEPYRQISSLPAINITKEKQLWGLSYLILSEFAEIWAQANKTDLSHWIRP